MGALMEDLRYGCRVLRKKPLFTSIAALTLALGIGANTAVFTLVNIFLMRSLAVQNPNELVFVRDRGPDQSPGPGFDLTSFKYLRDNNHALAGLVAFDDSNISAVVDSIAEYDRIDFVSGNYYALLGVTALKGRLLTESDDQPGSSPVVVLSYEYWRRRFGGNPAVLGKVVRFKDIDCTIIGITAANFRGVDSVGNGAAFTAPLKLHPYLALKDHTTFELFGRLGKGARMQQAEADLNVIFHQALQHEAGRITDPAERHALSLRRIALLSASRGEFDDENFSLELRILQAIVGLILLIACANIANLLLASGTSRQKEMALRLSLGASRRRIIRQLLTENFLLASLGGSLGFLLGIQAVRLLLIVLRQTPGSDFATLGVDAGTLVFTATVSLAAVLIFGLIPALRASDIRLIPALKQDSVGLSNAGRASRTTSVLLTSQVAMSLIVLVLAGLLLRTLHNLQQVKLGFESNRLVLFWLFPTLAGYDESREVQVSNDVVAHLRTVPGVRSATLTRYSILRNGREKGLLIANQERRSYPDETYVLSAVGPDFFRTLGIPVMLGRDFTVRDDAAAPPVAIVNQAFANKYFPAGNPTGAVIKNSGETVQRTIVGVVGDMKFGVRDLAPADAVYVPYAQAPSDMRGQMLITLSTSLPVGAILPEIPKEVQKVAKDLPVVGLTTENEEIRSKSGDERSLTQLLGSFGLLALSLTLVGLYGNVAFAVSRRTREIAIRMALGAEPTGILRMVLRESLGWVFLGIATGVPLALAATHLLRSFLFGVPLSDPLTYAIISAVLLGTTLVAAYLPARRGSQVAPAAVLKYE